MKNAVNTTTLRNRYNAIAGVLTDAAAHEKAVLLSLLIYAGIPYHMHNGRLVLDSKKCLKLDTIANYYAMYMDCEVLSILIDCNVWYRVENGKLTYTAADVPAADVPAADVPAADVPAADVPAAGVPGAGSGAAPEKKIACKTKAEKLTDDTEIKRVEVVTLDEKKKMRIVWTAVYTIGKLKEVVSYFLKFNKPEEFWLYETESGRGIKLVDYARMQDIKPIKKPWEEN